VLQPSFGRTCVPLRAAALPLPLRLCALWHHLLLRAPHVVRWVCLLGRQNSELKREMDKAKSEAKHARARLVQCENELAIVRKRLQLANKRPGTPSGGSGGGSGVRAGSSRSSARRSNSPAMGRPGSGARNPISPHLSLSPCPPLSSCACVCVVVVVVAVHVVRVTRVDVLVCVRPRQPSAQPPLLRPPALRPLLPACLRAQVWRQRRAQQLARLPLPLAGRIGVKRRQAAERRLALAHAPHLRGPAPSVRARASALCPADMTQSARWHGDGFALTGICLCLEMLSYPLLRSEEILRRDRERSSEAEKLDRFRRPARGGGSGAAARPSSAERRRAYHPQAHKRPFCVLCRTYMDLWTTG
jgi:hypothetical protein